MLLKIQVEKISSCNTGNVISFRDWCCDFYKMVAKVDTAEISPLAGVAAVWPPNRLLVTSWLAS